MGFVSILLLPILMFIGFVVIFVIIFLIACAVVFVAFTVLSVIMFVKSNMRKKEHKRMVPFFPLSIVFASFALDALIPLLIAGGIYTSYVTKLPSDYVSKTLIDQNGYQSERFSVDGEVYKRIDNIVFTNKADEYNDIPFYSYTYTNPLEKYKSGNYYKIPVTSGCKLIRGRKHQNDQNYDYFTLESDYDKVVDYFTNVNSEYNSYDLNICDEGYKATSYDYSDYRSYFLENFSFFKLDNYSASDGENIYNYIRAEFNINIFDVDRFTLKASVNYCVTDEGWYLLEPYSYSQGFTRYGYKFNDDIQVILNKIYDIK